jgi:hypothetical protein
MKRVLMAAAFGLSLAQAGWSQSFCASDGQPSPTALQERFISADCEACWRAPPAAARAGALTIDWIVPSARANDAPLAAAATRDALTRLQALGLKRPARSRQSKPQSVLASPQTLRVAHGLAVNDYVGASIEMTPATPGTWTAWLLLVETIPAGVEGTPVARLLARNMLQATWNMPPSLSNEEQLSFQVSRPMSIPPGANPQALSVVGWVQDTQGRIRSMAQSRCMAQP